MTPEDLSQNTTGVSQLELLSFMLEMYKAELSENGSMSFAQANAYANTLGLPLTPQEILDITSFAYIRNQVTDILRGNRRTDNDSPHQAAAAPLSQSIEDDTSPSPATATSDHTDITAMDPMLGPDHATLLIGLVIS